MSLAAAVYGAGDSTMGSSDLAITEACDLEIPSMPSVFTRPSTRRVETPRTGDSAGVNTLVILTLSACISHGGAHRARAAGSCRRVA